MLTIDAANRSQYVRQLVNVKHTGMSAIGQRRDAMGGIRLAFIQLRMGSLDGFAHASLFAVHEDLPS
jgi:hypothetical protein